MKQQPLQESRGPRPDASFTPAPQGDGKPYCGRKVSKHHGLTALVKPRDNRWAAPDNTLALEKD